jgi:hypothetical protein
MVDVVCQSFLLFFKIVFFRKQNIIRKRRAWPKKKKQHTREKRSVYVLLVLVRLLTREISNWERRTAQASQSRRAEQWLCLIEADRRA